MSVDAPWSPERRNRRRFPLMLPIRFTVRLKNTALCAGDGTTVNISSSGLLFDSTTPLNAGDHIVAAVEWPPHSKPLGVFQLMVAGRVVRAEQSRAAVAIYRHNFVSEWGTAREPAQRPDESRHHPILVVESEEIHNLIAAMAARLQYRARRVSVDEALEVLRKPGPPASLLITNTIQAFAGLNLSIPVVLLAVPGNRPTDPRHQFARMVVLDKPPIYSSLMAALRGTLGASRTTAAGQPSPL